MIINGLCPEKSTGKKIIIDFVVLINIDGVDLEKLRLKLPRRKQFNKEEV